MEPGCSCRQKRCGLKLDLGLRQRVRDALVGTDRRLPYGTHRHVARSLGEGVTTDAEQEGRARDALGIQTVEYLGEAGTFDADQPIRAHTNVVEVQPIL